MQRNVLADCLASGRLMLAAEVGPYFNRSANTIRRWGWAGKLPRIPVNGSYQYNPNDVAELLRKGFGSRRRGRPRGRA